MNVLKRSGRKQKFSMNKLARSIEKAMKEAKISPARRKKLTKDVCESMKKGLKGKRVIKAVDLRKRVLGRLDKCCKKASKAWRKYDRKRR